MSSPKTYIIRRLPDDTVTCTVQLANDLHSSPSELHHVIRHSPTGFEFGYAGSGPADLALSILTDLLEYEPSVQLYQSFKHDIIATISRSAKHFTITSNQIGLWALKKFNGRFAPMGKAR